MARWHSIARSLDSPDEIPARSPDRPISSMTRSPDHPITNSPQCSSCRSAMIGSMRAARSAGQEHACRPAASSMQRDDGECERIERPTRSRPGARAAGRRRGCRPGRAPCPRAGAASRAVITIRAIAPASGAERHAHADLVPLLRDRASTSRRRRRRRASAARPRRRPTAGSRLNRGVAYSFVPQQRVERLDLGAPAARDRSRRPGRRPRA